VFTPDTVQAVYGVDVAVRRDPFTHGVYVMPSSARAISSKNGRRVHVLCGGGTGGPLMRALVDNGYSASVGVLNVLDSDYEIASDLRIPVVAEVPFAQISEEMHAENLRRVDESSVVVVSRFPVGPGNFKNLEAAMHALDSGKKVFMFRPANSKAVDFVGGKADAYIGSLVDKGATEVRDTDALIAAIEGGSQD
jgi:iron complex transport system ATP-binding protein